MMQRLGSPAFRGFFLTIFAAAVPFVLFEPISFGFKDSDISNFRLVQVVVIGLGSYFGIFSKVIFDRISQEKRKIMRPRRDATLAAIVAPLVMYPIYSSLKSVDDIVILLLVSYQNGFFFSVVLEKIQSASSQADS